MNSLQKRERRNKLEIYNDILSAILQESKNVNIIKPTRIQFQSNLSYDTLSKHLADLKEKKLIHNSEGIGITQKGKMFLKDYEKIRKYTEQMGLDYL